MWSSAVSRSSVSELAFSYSFNDCPRAFAGWAFLPLEGSGFRPLKPASRRAAFGTQVQIVRFRTMSVNNSVASPEHSLAEEARFEREALFTAMSLIMAHLGRDKRIANERQFAEAIASALLAARSDAWRDK